MQITQPNSLFPAVASRVLSPILGFTALIGVLVAAPRAAQAQGRTLFPIRLKLGVYLPSDKDTRNISSSRHLSGEVEVALNRTGSSGGQTLLSVGYSYKSGSDFESQSSYQVIPVSLTQIISPPKRAGRATSNIYYGAGVGLYFVRVFDTVDTTRLTPSSTFVYSKRRTLIGASIVAGYQTPSSFFIEGKYHIVTGTVEGYSPNGLSLFVGVRL